MGSKQYMNFYVHFFYDYAILCIYYAYTMHVFISKSLDLRSTSEGMIKFGETACLAVGFEQLIFR